MRYIIHHEDHADNGRLGGKASALAALRSDDLPIPAWFVLAPEAFYASVSEAERSALEAAEEGNSLRAIPDGLELALEVRAQLAQALAELCPNGERVAVRSSARDEDGAQRSFAGQLDSFLFVHHAEVATKVAAVWRSAFSERVFAYRRKHGLGLMAPPAVLIQRMVNAELSGVAFGADPVSGRRGVAVVAALFGLGTALVSGECDADTYHVDRDGRIIRREIVEKRLAHRNDPTMPEGVRPVEVAGEDAKRAALDDHQILAVAALARRAGRHFGRPQDIEWAIEDGRLYLLQSRPITSLYEVGDPDGALCLWDNSNIAESYPGVTMPLTFSFARLAYEEVYRQFCRLMRVPAAMIAAHSGTFRRMLGLIRGRVYYNLLNWYRLLSMLPGFTVNRRFMEQMMGVREGLPESLLAEFPRPTWPARFKDGFNLLASLSALTVNHCLLPRRIRRFRRRLDAALGEAPSRLEYLRADELAAYYHELERRLLTRWDAPLINDFFAMIFFGLLRRLSEKWCGDSGGTLHNDLLCGDGRIISAEPARRMRDMARVAAGHPDFVALLCTASLDCILEEMGNVPEFRRLYLDYLGTFGERCPGELKLESPTLHDDPLPFLRSVGELSRNGHSSGPPHRPEVEGMARKRAEARVRGVLGRWPLHWVLFRWVLRHARARVRDRENLRFERTRVFGRVRRIFVEIGRRFHALELLGTSRDIFFLEVGEILGFIEGTATSTNLKDLVALRKAEYAIYGESKEPPERFETRGTVHHGNILSANGGRPVEPGGNERRGIGCCPGIARGQVRIITDPRNARLLNREILVAERTDPGWVMLFSSASGLLVERGSLLSHSAIVAREMGIPSIVSIAGVTRWLKDGDWVELDGSSGVVRRVEPAGWEAGHAP
jgi:pyruvate,water dikinase